MYCVNCGYQSNDGLPFCIKCGQRMQPGAQKIYNPAGVRPRKKRAAAIAIAILSVALVTLVLVLIFTANPIAGRWYGQDGTELIMLKNGKGMTVSDTAGEPERIHFMYAIEYQEPGYIEGEIYEKDNSASAWFYLYNDTLEMNGVYYYRQKPSSAA